jgi:outer membrane receptor for ferrienterochelin and colicins
MKLKFLKYFLLLIPPLVFALQTNAQQKQIHGMVMVKQDKKEVPLPGANVYWLGTTTGTTTDVEGHFQLPIPTEVAPVLVVSYVGFQSDTINVSGKENIKVALQSSVSLKEVEVIARQQSNSFSISSPINVEKITAKELQKAACCNLSESFETNASVDVSYSDAVTGAKEIQMLGLAGIYTQIQTENFPAVRGLSKIYGLSYIPGTWMESIKISKGTESVLNGFEAITGQINVDYKKPWLSDRLYVNLYGAGTGNTEFNAEASHIFNEKWSTMLYTHGEYFQNELDHNHDNFMDMPKVKQYNVMNRWKYSSSGKFEGQIGFKALGDLREGGQIKSSDQNGHIGQKYSTELKTDRYELFTKSGLIFKDKPNKSFGLITHFVWHDQNGFFGNNYYNALQQSIYSNFIYQNIIKTTNHTYRLGASLMYDLFDEQYAFLNLDREEIVPGVYGEYIYTNPGKYTLVGGLRVDHHNEFGIFITPRVHTKFDLGEATVIRLTGGKGTRTAHIIADNVSVLASSRNIILTERLFPERAWNYGASFTHYFYLKSREAGINIDLYRTDFENQVVMDTYTDANSIFFYNLDGKSYSNSFQIQLNYELLPRLDVKAAYRLDDVISTYNGVESRKPLTARHKGLFNVGYYTNFEKWLFDATLHYTGSKPLPSTSLFENQLDGESVTSPDYVTVNSQVTRNFKQWAVYAGVENLTNYTQEDVIIDAENPFGNNFDASVLWGPLMERKIYAGLRYTIK